MATTSWKFAGSGSSVDRGGQANTWGGTGNISAEDGSTASYGYSAPGSGYSSWLYGSNFGFTTSDIPSGSTIDGIELRINRRHQQVGGTGSSQDSALHLTTNGTSTTGDNKASATTYPASLTKETYGGASDLWGATITDSTARSSSFGVFFSTVTTSLGFAINVVHCDCIEMRIHYTEGEGGGDARRRITSSFLS